MKNYRMYLPGFREMKEYLEDDEDYSLNYKLYMKSEFHEHGDYVVPVKREKKIKKLFTKNSMDHTIRNKVVAIRSSSAACSYFRAEYRENQISEDASGNLLVPYSYMYDEPKTR